nr:transposase [Photorhabdus bodei]
MFTFFRFEVNGWVKSDDEFNFKSSSFNNMISNVKNSIRGTYHSISKKYLPRYLAEFCFRFNWRFNLKKTFEQLIYSCIRVAPIPEYLLKLAEIRW